MNLSENFANSWLRLCMNESCPHVNESCRTFEWVMSHIWMSRIVLSGLAEGALHRVAHSQQRERARARARERERVCVWERRIHRHTDTKADTDASTEADMQIHFDTTTLKTKNLPHTTPLERKKESRDTKHLWFLKIRSKGSHLRSKWIWNFKNSRRYGVWTGAYDDILNIGGIERGDSLKQMKFSRVYDLFRVYLIF